MKNKLINIKNLLRIVISVMIIISMAKSCAKAYTFDEFLNYCELIKQYSTNTNNKNCANWVVNNKTTIQGYLNSISDLNEYTTWYCCYQGSTSAYGGNMYLAMQKKGTAWNWNNAIKSTPTTGWLIRRYGTGTSPTGSWQSVALQSANMSYYGTTTNYIGLIDEEQATTLNINFSGKEWNNFYQQYGTNYLEFNNALDNTAYNGNLLTYYYQGDFYSNSQTLLGNILPNDSYYFEIRLKESTTGIVKGTSFVSLNTTPINIYNDGAIEINDNYEVYAINRLLKYSTQYQLEIESYYGDGGDNLYEDIDWFIFLPTNALISGDSIQDFGSGEFTTQDSTNQIIDNNQDNTDNIIASVTDSTEVDNIMGEYTSGDIETISSDLGFSALDNPFTSFLFFVVEGVYDVLTEREDIVLNTQYKSIQFNLASTDFITPQSELKTFIRNMLVCIYIYGNYKWFHYMITLLETARINKFMAEIGTDEFYDTDIM